MASSTWVVETTDATFETDVVARSREVPVVVDFWAEWCAPCRMLAPVLQQLADEYAGRFVLAKANTELTPQAAAQFGVQSIPAVFCVFDGEIYDFFAGALPERQLRAWLDRMLDVVAIGQTKKLEATDPNEAARRYRDLIARFPQDSTAAIGLARVLLAQQQWDECQAVIADLEARGFLEPEAEKVKAALELHRAPRADLAKLRAAVAAQPNDLSVQLKLAEALAGQNLYQEALETALAIVQRDKLGAGQQAKQLMVDIFRVLPEDSELTTTFRRKLTLMLY